MLASSIVLRLQGIVSREIAPSDFGVVTVGAIKVGSAPNVISDQAELLINVRAYDNAVREKILQVVDRIVRGRVSGVRVDRRSPPWRPSPRSRSRSNDPAVTEQ